MKLKGITIIVVLVILAFANNSVFAQKTFAEYVGSVRVADVKDISLSPMRIPMILWGAESAHIHANGCELRTQPGSIFAKLGLDIELFRCDDPYQQAREYREGKTAFFRGTFGMDGSSSEIFGSDVRTIPEQFIHLTWSTGDHVVASDEIKNLSDLAPDATGKKKRVALQRNGPHDIGFLDDVLARATVVGKDGKIIKSGLTRDDVEIVWTKDVSGKEGPAALLRKTQEEFIKAKKAYEDAAPNSPQAKKCFEALKIAEAKKIDVVFVITPEMIGLTGGYDKTGIGGETLKGAHVVMSTAILNYSIADTLECRKDFADAHPDIRDKIAAGILKAQEEVIELRKAYLGPQDTPQAKEKAKEYKKLLEAICKIYGEDVPTIEDADGLIADCSFVGWFGQGFFYNDKSNPHGFDVMQKSILNIVTSRGYAKARQGIIPSRINWNSPVFDFLTMKKVEKGPRLKAEMLIEDIENLKAGSSEGDIIDPFTIQFEEDQSVFSEETYGVPFQNIFGTLAKSGNVEIDILGHVDPSLLIGVTLDVGLNTIDPATGKPILQRSGTPGNYTYYMNGKVLDVTSIPTLIELVKQGKFEGVSNKYFNMSPKDAVQSTVFRSTERAEYVRSQIIGFVKSKGVTINEDQIRAIGAGASKPLVSFRESAENKKKNMRAEVHVRGLKAEQLNPRDFDY